MQKLTTAALFSIKLKYALKSTMLRINFNADTTLLKARRCVRLSDEIEAEQEYNFNADLPLLEKLNTKHVAV